MSTVAARMERVLPVDLPKRDAPVRIRSMDAVQTEELQQQ